MFVGFALLKAHTCAFVAVPFCFPLSKINAPVRLRPHGPWPPLAPFPTAAIAVLPSRLAKFLPMPPNRGVVN